MNIPLLLLSLVMMMMMMMINVAESKTRVFSAIVEMLRWFAGPQIRNAAVKIISASCRFKILYIVRLHAGYFMYNVSYFAFFGPSTRVHFLTPVNSDSQLVCQKMHPSSRAVNSGRELG